MNDDREIIFNKLVNEKATCLEFALNGFIRIYEKDEPKCECQSCENLKQIEPKGRKC